VKLRLEDISEDEIQRAMAVRRPGRYGKPYIIDEVIYIDNEKSIMVYTYESLDHQSQGRGFRPSGELIPLDELPQIKRYINIHKILE